MYSYELNKYIFIFVSWNKKNIKGARKILKEYSDTPCAYLGYNKTKYYIINLIMSIE